VPHPHPLHPDTIASVTTTIIHVIHPENEKAETQEKEKETEREILAGLSPDQDLPHQDQYPLASQGLDPVLLLRNQQSQSGPLVGKPKDLPLQKGDPIKMLS